VGARALADALGPRGDLPASLIPDDRRVVGLVVVREEGVLAGSACATEVFAHLARSTVVRWRAGDGEEVGPDETVAEVEGLLASVLTAERTALNFLQHLSG